MESVFNTRTSLKKKLSPLFFVFLVLNCFTEFRCVAKLLPLEEVEALEAISRKLQINNWNISQNFCSGVNVRTAISDIAGVISNVTCNCTTTFCHVTHILLRRQNLTGELPAEFANLTYLEEIDLEQNNIHGSIPASFGQLPLVTLSLWVNRISGSIPEEIGNIAPLDTLILENNRLEGPLPRSIGNLNRLRRFYLSGNNFNGTLPEEFSKLKSLTDFRIDGSKISGKIPDWIGNWTLMDRLYIQGTSMEGPLPSTISELKELITLRVSDLIMNGSMWRFPDLRDFKKLEELVLRNCLINDTIPSYIGDRIVLPKLTALDLSFNKLTGSIPEIFESSGLENLFLSNNLLSGKIPEWIIRSIAAIDISYNNFTDGSGFDCKSSTKNVASSTSSSVESNPNIDWCLKKDLPCPNKPQYDSLFINCGATYSTTFEGNTYEEDPSTLGPSYFFVSPKKNWAYSSTGLFMNNVIYAKYVADKLFSLNVTDEIFKTARLAPSLKYYGLCLRKGTYKVRLHFAEIMFTDDQTFRSTGKRIFDVSIQGNLVLKDFNIMEEAQGPGKNITKEFKDVLVSGSTLEIHLWWSGNGTNAVPDMGVYGPLISAISVTPISVTPKIDTGVLSVGAVVGIVAASCVVFVLILLVLRVKGYLGGKDLEDKELRGLDMQTGYFTLRQIKAATNNFDSANKIGEGGFGSVYKGALSDGTEIAVKQLSPKSRQGNREFVNEIGMISAVQHPNLVRLYGCCIEGNQLLLIYEYMENNNLGRALFGHEEHRLNLDWPTRNNICLGIARGLAYLHEESRLKIVHRDIKAANVLLDKDLNAKISDFGLAKLDEEENTHISTKIVGTIGYMAPEYAIGGYLTDKADVYSFGVVLLETVSGKSITNNRRKEEFVHLVEWACISKEQGNLLELVDPRLGSNYSKEEATRILNLSLLCTNQSAAFRPSMSSAVSMLEGNSPVQEPLLNLSSVSEELRFKAFEELSQDSQTYASTSSQDSQVRRSISDKPLIDSSISIQSNKNESLVKTSSSKLFSDLIL